MVLRLESVLKQQGNDGPGRNALEGTPLIEDAEIVDEPVRPAADRAGVGDVDDVVDVEVTDEEVTDGEAGPGYASGAYEAGEYASGGYRSGRYRAGEYEPGEYEPGEYEPGEYEPGEYEPGEYTAGDYEVGDYSSPGFDTGGGLGGGRSGTSGTSAGGRSRAAAAESPAYAYLVGSKRVPVPSGAGVAAPEPVTAEAAPGAAGAPGRFEAPGPAAGGPVPAPQDVPHGATDGGAVGEGGKEEAGGDATDVPGLRDFLGALGARPGPGAVPASAPARDPYEPEVIGAVPPVLPAQPGRLPRYSDDLPHLSVPDCELDGGEHDGIVLRAASLRGDAARRDARPRRDAVRLARVGEGKDALLVLAVADGLGTAPYSHVGAHYACSTIVETVARFQPELVKLLRAATGTDGGNGDGGPVAPGEQPDDVRHLVNYAQEMCRRTDILLAKLAQQAELPAEQCATSLRVLLVPIDPDTGARLMFAVGGGAFVRLRGGDWLPIELAEDDRRGSVGLPGSWDQVRVAVQTSRPGDLLIACTDGLAELLPTPGVAERLAEQWGRGRAPGLAEFLHHLQVRVKPYDDDRSAVCVWERRG